MAQYFSVARRQITGILCVFQDLTTKLHAKTTSQIVQVISEKFLRQEEYRLMCRIISGAFSMLDVQQYAPSFYSALLQIAVLKL
jgi:hypothetical protein